MAQNEKWICIEIVNSKNNKTMKLYHPPKDGAAGEDVDRDCFIP